MAVWQVLRFQRIPERSPEASGILGDYPRSRCGLAWGLIPERPGIPRGFIRLSPLDLGIEQEIKFCW